MHAWKQILYHKDKWVTREMAAFLELANVFPDQVPPVESPQV
jgi:hypothetical protein